MATEAGVSNTFITKDQKDYISKTWTSFSRVVTKWFLIPLINFKNKKIRNYSTKITSPSDPLVINLIQTYTNFKPEFLIKGSFEVFQKLLYIKLTPHFKLLSSDINNLFLKIPFSEISVNNLQMTNKLK